MATIALVDVNASRADAGEALPVGDHRAERMAVEGIAVQRLGVEHELAALGPGRRGGERDLAAELVGCARLALGPRA
jgi:hypothetical protein